MIERTCKNRKKRWSLKSLKEEKDEEEEEDAEMKKNGLKNEKKTPMHWIENVITGWK